MANNGKTWIRIAITIIVIFVGYIVTNDQLSRARDTKIISEVNPIKVDVAVTKSDIGNLNEKFETHSIQQTVDTARFDRTFDKLDAKLDRLLEK